MRRQETVTCSQKMTLQRPEPTIEVAPMEAAFLVWRCLHSGPLTSGNIDEWPTDGSIDWQRYRKRNIPLLEKLMHTYGACAILARVGGQVVGQLRFYPRIVWNMERAGELCLQQDFPNGPSEDFVIAEFPPLSELEDRTLAIHCLMIDRTLQDPESLRRRGIGSRMVRYLIAWARIQGWETIEVDAFEDIPIIYEITGSAGITFWHKLGFRIHDRHPHPYLQESSDFVLELEEQAKSAGIPPERAKDRIVMRFALT